MSDTPAPNLGSPTGVDESALAVADVYAEALLEAADEKGEADVVSDELNHLVMYMKQDTRFTLFMTADTIDDEPRRASLEKLFRGRMNDLLLNLLQVLNNRRRTGLIRAVARRVQLRMEARRRQQEITIRTPMPLTDARREQIKQGVSRHIGKEALLIEEIDPDLIGGFVLQVGDVQVDASVSSRMETLRRRLMERATVEVHQGDRYVLET